MNIRLRFMVVATAIVLLPLLLSGGTQGVQGAQQDVSLESRISQLQQEVGADPRNPDLHFELSKYYEENRQYDESLSEFGLAVDNGLKNRPYNLLNKSVINANNVGLGLWQAGNHDAAIESFKVAIGLDPSNPKSYSNVGITYSSKKDYEEALRYMKKAIDLSPMNIMYHQSIGNTYVRKGDFKLALLSYNKIGHINPKHNEQYYGIARAYHGLGQYRDAIDALDQLPRDLRKNDTVKAFREECKKLLK